MATDNWINPHTRIEQESRCILDLLFSVADSPESESCAPYSAPLAAGRFFLRRSCRCLDAEKRLKMKMTGRRGRRGTEKCRWKISDDSFIMVRGHEFFQYNVFIGFLCVSTEESSQECVCTE